VFIGSDDGFLHAVNLSTGRSAWKFDAGDKVRSTPTIANELIYVGSESGEFFAVDYRGALKWRFQAKRGISSSPAASAQAVYASSQDGVLYCLGAQDGWPVWRYRLGKGSVSSPAAVENLLILGAADGFIYCVEIQTGREVWRFRLSGRGVLRFRGRQPLLPGIPHRPFTLEI
jgi:outer membrane protein assembly factor BamB